MAQKIEAREVLAHLNQLGYTNITAQQLKEFLKDLKKVIKYDQRFGGASEDCPQPPREPSEEVARLAAPRHISVHIVEKRPPRHEHCVHSSEPLAAAASTGSTQRKVPFIRAPGAKPSLNKCDPVALYHYYQAEWKKSKIPGQDKRDELRWAIRERMLNGPRVEPKSKCRLPR